MRVMIIYDKLHAKSIKNKYADNAGRKIVIGMRVK